MTGLRLYKKEKLCSLTAIEQLFSPSSSAEGGNNSVMAYPWRAVWRCKPRPDGNVNPRFLITVPKKRLRRAVDRVRMRRLMREAYRLNRLPELACQPLDIAFIYVADILTPQATSVKSVRKILDRILSTLNNTPSTPNSSAK